MTYRLITDKSTIHTVLISQQKNQINCTHSLLRDHYRCVSSQKCSISSIPTILYTGENWGCNVDNPRNSCFIEYHQKKVQVPWKIGILHSNIESWLILAENAILFTLHYNHYANPGTCFHTACTSDGSSLNNWRRKLPMSSSCSKKKQPQNHRSHWYGSLFSKMNWLCYWID